MQDDWLNKCFYRVSLKAVITNDKGEVLLVREQNNPAWNLPGGGLDYGEDDYTALKRELYEEVGYTGEFSFTPVATRPMFLDAKQAWQLWIVYRVHPETFDFSVGHEADEIAFMDLKAIKDERPNVYKFAKLALG